MTDKEKALQISNAVAELDEDIIIEADAERKLTPKTIKINKTKKFIIPAISAAACAAIISGIIFGGLNGQPSIINLPVYAEVLAEAEYPDQAPYPDESKIFADGTADGTWDSDLWMSIYEPWSEQNSERHDAYEQLDLTALKQFSDVTVKQFLTNSEGENRVYSPVNLYMALSLLAEITEGNSRKQILELTGFDNIEDLRNQAANLWKYLYCDDGASTITPANSLWLGMGTEFNSDTIQRLANDYFASVYHGDMAEEETLTAIKNWLNEQTDSLLENAVDSLDISPDTVMLLCSALNFKARWDWTFQKENNDMKTFHGLNCESEVEFMNDSLLGSTYYWGEDYGAVKLDFIRGGSMWIILPDEGKTVDDVLNSSEYLDMMTDTYNFENRMPTTVNLSLPKFDVSSDMDLVEGLKELNVTDVFDSVRADFSPLFKDENYSGVSVSQIKHAARVIIDEEGCTAAAFTAMAFDGAAPLPNEEMDFIVDRPFVFTITSKSTVLFAGAVNNLS